MGELVVAARGSAQTSQVIREVYKWINASLLAKAWDRVSKVAEGATLDASFVWCIGVKWRRRALCHAGVKQRISKSAISTCGNTRWRDGPRISEESATIFKTFSLTVISKISGRTCCLTFLGGWVSKRVEPYRAHIHTSPSILLAVHHGSYRTFRNTCSYRIISE